MKISETKEGPVLEVYVKPRSREFKVVVEGGEVTVYCREDPVRGRVNRELINQFSRFFHKEVELVSGFASREKKLLIRGAERSEVEAILNREQSY